MSIAVIVDELERAYDGAAWHGPSFLATLEGVTAEQAAAHPIAGAHSIWELVLHVAGWTDEIVRRMAGAVAGTPPEGDWPAPPEPTAENWSATKEQFRQAQDRLLAAVRVFPEERLGEHVRVTQSLPDVDVSFAVSLHGISQHYAYHGGQVMLLRRAMGWSK